MTLLDPLSIEQGDAAPREIEEGSVCQVELDPETRNFYRQTILALSEAQIPFLVGGAYAFAAYTGIERKTKDIDLFVAREDLERTFEALQGVGYQTELVFPHWLAKAYCGNHFVDLIFSSGNGIAAVDQLWFEHAGEDQVLGIPVKLLPPEEMIWSTAFIMERERYDGAVVAHLIRGRGEQIDWRRLVDRFGDHWRVLMSHVVLFGFIYPTERAKVPAWVMQELCGRLHAESRAPAPEEPICQGTLISRAQYLTDLDRWGYADARLEPRGPLSEEEVAIWTEAIKTGK